MTDPLTAAANAISAASPNVRKFAQLSAQRQIALEARVANLEPAPPAVSLPVWQLTLQPNWANAGDPATLQSCWLWSNSGWGYAPPNGHDPFRVLLLDPRLTDSRGRVGVDTWEILVTRYWPASYQPGVHGTFGTEASFHNVAGDAGSGSTVPPNGGVGWGFGSQVSAILFQWRPQDPTPSWGFEYAKSGGLIVPLPAPARDTLLAYRLTFTAGRTDGSTARPGAVRAYAPDGQVVADLSNMNTVQQQLGPDGKRYTQRWMAASYDGDYTARLLQPATTRFCATRVGPTIADAIADTPSPVGSTVGGQQWNGSQPNLGPPTLQPVG